MNDGASKGYPADNLCTAGPDIFARENTVKSGAYLREFPPES